MILMALVPRTTVGTDAPERERRTQTDREIQRETGRQRSAERQRNTERKTETESHRVLQRDSGTSIRSDLPGWQLSVDLGGSGPEQLGDWGPQGAAMGGWRPLRESHIGASFPDPGEWGAGAGTQARQGCRTRAGGGTGGDVSCHLQSSGLLLGGRGPAPGGLRKGPFVAAGSLCRH